MKTDRIITLLAGSLMLTAISAAIAHYAIQDTQKRTDLVFHTYEIIGQATELLSLLKDAEGAQRGYQITGDTTYLHPWYNAQRKIPFLIDSLQNFVAGNAQQHQRLNDDVLPKVEARLNVISTSLSIYKQNGQAAVFAYIREGHGIRTMDSVRAALTRFTDAEKSMLAQRLKEMSAIRQRQTAVWYLSLAIIALVSLIALITIIQKQHRNNQLILQLKHANDTLECKVQERTQELEEKNKLSEKLSDDLRNNFEELESFYEALQVRSNTAEESLREIKDLYDHAPCGYHSVDASGLIVRMNETELAWLGYTREEVVGKKNIAELMLAEDIQHHLEGFRLFKERGYIQNLEITFIRKDGTKLSVLINSTAIYDSEKNYSKSRSTAVDISDRKVIEQKLLEANKDLTILNEEKNHFLGIAAHDLKSPINSILGLINLMRLEGKNLEPAQREYLNFIQTACSNMQMLITNLLDINRIEQGITILNPEVVKINELLKRQLQAFREQAASKNIVLSLYDEVPDKTLLTDAASLHRIVENLLSNAIKFSPAGKEVMVRLVHDDDTLKIEVRDQGQGISEEDKQQLFRKFQKLSAKPTAGEGSTGLGLSIVKELVTLLKGRIWVENNESQGAAFIVELPVHDTVSV